MAHKAEVTTGQLDHVPTELLSQFHSCFISGGTHATHAPPPADVIGMPFERVEVELTPGYWRSSCSNQ